jgi:hypothetical protein
MGWLASFVQLMSTTLFSISNVAAAPGVLPKEDDTNYGVWDGLVWTPQASTSKHTYTSALLFKNMTIDYC